MKISYNWLCSYLSVSPDVKELEKILTDCGLEVEKYEKVFSIEGGLTGLLVGRVTSCTKHPNADKLSLTKVDIGNESELQIVCGAPNVEKGQKVVVATIGTTLFPKNGEPFEIKKTKIRGEVSEGMICAEDEIGVGYSHEGIIVLTDTVSVGEPVANYFGVEEDYIFEIGLTPNRVDAASHIGVARDVVAVLALKQNMQLLKPCIEAFKTSAEKPKIEVIVQHLEACPRYSGIYISGVTVKESPQWLKNKLKFIGLKPINNIVDVTNFVLHELGQPLHAFDADKIEGNKVIVDTLTEGTIFETLDGVLRTLSANDLMICNEKEGMCIAGVFGGSKSGITQQTKNIFIESAYFNPAFIRRTSKKHALYTDASFRYERGADPNITIYALKRACLLIQEVGGGEMYSPIIDVYPNPINDCKINFDFEYLNKIAGNEIPIQVQKSIIKNLEIKIDSETATELQLSIPPFKVDVTRKVDVAEEILRIYGYDKIEIPILLHTTISTIQKPDKQKLLRSIFSYLISSGFSEILTNSLSNSAYYTNQPNAVKVLNALSSELDTLRASMLYGGLESIAYNMNRRNTNLKFFELGKVYTQNENKYEESEKLALFITGERFKESWNNPPMHSDIFELKGTVANLFTILSVCEKEVTTQYNLTLHGLQDAIEYSLKETPIAIIGNINKGLLKQFDIDKPVFFAEINIENLLKGLRTTGARYKDVSKFIGVRRDLAILFNKEIRFSEVKELAYKTEKKLLKEVQIFDVYEGKNIESGKKSYAIAFYLQNEAATLTDKEIENSMQKIQQAIEQQLGGKIRA
ncbi:MAG: phenylalanine--tRNA ligase subunit beta [Flavobacteriales bacterium]|nr:phenylalanine--tRNA ligase subunit beta [Flavobacteriales bacterium]